MPNHFIDELILSEYTSGSLGEGQSAIVAAHLTLCPESRKMANLLDTIGAVTFESNASSSSSNDSSKNILNDSTLQKVLKNIENTEQIDSPNTISKNMNDFIPKPINEKLPSHYSDLKWKRMGKSIRYINLDVKESDVSMKLLKIAPGTKIPGHSHEGNEYTLVLSGKFSDKFGSYERGDVTVRDEQDTHEPFVDGDSECVCVILTEGPLKYKGLVGFIAGKLFTHKN